MMQVRTHSLAPMALGVGLSQHFDAHIDVA